MRIMSILNALDMNRYSSSSGYKYSILPYTDSTSYFESPFLTVVHRPLLVVSLLLCLFRAYIVTVQVKLAPNNSVIASVVFAP
jgi:hypothetical protein